MKYKLLLFLSGLFLCYPLFRTEGEQQQSISSNFALNQTPMQQCLSAKTIHEASRLKGSGMIIELITDTMIESTYLLPMRSAEKAAIETWLGQFKH